MLLKNKNEISQKYFKSVACIAVIVVGVILSMLLVGMVKAEAGNVSAKIEPKIVVPADAVIIPYTINGENYFSKLPKPEELNVPDVVMVPLDLHLKMTELVKSADDIRLKFQRPTPINIVAAAAEYVAEELPQTGNEIVLDGKIYIRQFQNEGTLLPFNIQNSIIESPQLDNKPASISSISNTQFVLRVSGQGEHVFTFKVRVKIQQEGGWRIAAGVLPTASTSKIQLTLPNEAGDLLTENSFDARKWTSVKNNSGTNKKITTALESNGNFVWRWRSAISEGTVDRSLEVESVVRVDLQDDAAWILWLPKFKISRGKWEMLRLQVPKNYTIAEVTGNNVRGWSIVANDNEAKLENIQTIDVELLKPVEGEELLQVRLFKNKPDSTTDKDESWNLSTLSVPEAGIHRGRIDLHRSSVREFHVTEANGASLTDQPATPINAAFAKISTTNPLGLTPFQSYRFIAEPFNLSITSKPEKKEISIGFTSIMKVTQKRSILETKISIATADRPFFATINLPKQFKLKKVTAPNTIFHSNEQDGDENLLYVAHGNKLNGRIVIGIEGDYLPMVPIQKDDIADKKDADKSKDTVKNTAKNTVAEIRQQYQIDQLPLFSAKFAGVAQTLVSKSATFELLTDMSLRAEAVNLQYCSLADILSHRHYITSPLEQRELVQLVIKDLSANSSAKLLFAETKPDVQCSTITNIKANSESINETILLDFNIKRAGIAEVKFMLPEWMRDAVIEAPFLQRKKLAERDVKRNDGTVLKFIDVTLELQESVIGHLRVLVQADRVLRVEKDYRIFVPIIETGTVTNQYVVMENDRLSTDEMVVDRAAIMNLENLDRRMQEWKYLAGMIGENVTEAYCIRRTNSEVAANNNSTVEASLAFKMKRRDAVRLSDAKINRAETRLMYDRNGEYRAEQIYHIDNQKEPYLDIVLPDNASLWDVRFFTAETWQQRDANQSPNQSRPEGTPVKPCKMTTDVALCYNIDKFQGVRFSLEAGKIFQEGVRIPLIKTDSGDLDYVVRIVYAGTSRGLGNLADTEMPFIKVLNVPVGTSLLKLYLPQNYKYFFHGNMQHVNKEQTTSIIKKFNDDYMQMLGLRLRKTMEDDNVYAKQRAYSNMKNSALLNNSNTENNNNVSDSNGNIVNNETAPKGIPTSQATQQRLQFDNSLPVPENIAQQSAAGASNSGMLRNQFESQANTFTSRIVNKKSIEVEDRGIFAFSMGDQDGYDRRNESKVNPVTNSINNSEFSDNLRKADTDFITNNTTLISAPPKSAKALEKIAPTNDENNKKSNQRSQALFNGNLVLGSDSQLNRQSGVAENGKVRNDISESNPINVTALKNKLVDNKTSIVDNVAVGSGVSSGVLPQVRDENSDFLRDENSDFQTGGNFVGSTSNLPIPELESTGSVSPLNNNKNRDRSARFAEPYKISDDIQNNTRSTRRRVMMGSMSNVASDNKNVLSLSNSISNKSDKRDLDSNNFESARVSGKIEQVTVQSLSTRMSGLDIAVPYNGELHIFTTPQGSLDLSLRALSDNTGSRVIWFFVSLICVGVVYLIYKVFIIAGKRLRARSR
ncbi:MAG: hypothetical protein LBJ00_07465 [Planctomycetaceae bacterium]|jgi:hypothetical protein|nr:hypothetical protein [Planctomycetaceae bacterium]